MKLKSLLNETAWLTELQDLNVCQSWNFFMQRFKSAMECSIPRYHKPQCRKLPYTNHKVIDLKHKKETLWKRFRRTGNHLDHLRLTEVRNSLRHLTRDLRSKFKMRIAKEVKTNPKAFWRYVNSKVRVKPSIPTLVDESLNDTEAATDEGKAEMLNKFFTSTFTRESMDNIPEFQDCDFVTSLDGISIDVGIVKEKLCDLNSSKATGPDELPPRVLKEAAAEISIPLSIIFKKSLSEGRLPPDWKVATIIPIFKKGNKSSPCNYRPVSLTSVVSKVFESIIREGMLEHLFNNNLMSPCQHGFLPRKSCMTQLLCALDDWTETLDSGNSVDVLYLDFKKAFDSVPHERLLKKIYAYGFRGDLFNWIQDFLKGRRQRVSVNGSMSGWSDVISGIPQGSVLGPLFFAIFINDLPSLLRNKVLLFADDTKIYSSISRANPISSLQDDINACIEWSVMWQLPFNISKCKILHIGQFNPRYCYNMDGMDIVKVNEEKDLGVLIDCNLKFHSQCSAVVNKANRLLGLIKQTFSDISVDSFTCLYKSIVRPILEYGNLVWGPYYKTDIQKLEKIQRKATRMIKSIRNLDYKERLKVLNLPSLHYRRYRGDMIAVYNMLYMISMI